MKVETQTQAQTEINDEQVQQALNQGQYASVRLAKTTIKRLDKKGKYRDSYDTIVSRLLDISEGKEISEDNRSW